MSAPILRFGNLTLGYDKHPAVHHLDGVVPEGALLAVVGPNGAGKSSLLKGIIGELRPLGGGLELSPAVRGRIAYLPQSQDIDRDFPIDVESFVMAGAWSRLGAHGAVSHQDAHRLHHALEHVGLLGFERRAIATLSGGQFQRALFARLLLQDAKLILLDEPFTAIDTATAQDLLGLVARWHGEQRTIIAVLHDLEQVRTHFPETLLLARDVIAWGPTPDALSPSNWAKARAMAEAWSDHAGVCAR
jgi:zinc/manganese transport system ATP-binding protein